MDTVELQGQIHKIYNGNLNSIITLFVKDTKNNFPQVIFMANDRNKLSGFKEGDYVHINGIIKTRGVKNLNGKKYKNYYNQFIRGLDISKVEFEKNNELGEEEEDNIEYINNVILNGEIVLSSIGHNLINIVIHPDGENFNLSISKYTKNPEKDLEDCKVGYRISVQCEIQTVRKVIKGETRFFENIIVKQLSTREVSCEE